MFLYGKNTSHHNTVVLYLSQGVLGSVGGHDMMTCTAKSALCMFTTPSAVKSQDSMSEHVQKQRARTRLTWS